MDSIQPDAGVSQALTLDQYSERDAKWNKHRSNTQTLGKHYEAEYRFQSLGRRMASCSTVLGFAHQADQQTGEISYKLRSAMFCHVRHCPVCQWRRSLRNTARFFSAIPTLAERFPTHRWLFLTLTVKNCKYDELRDTIKAMNAAWKRLIERKDWPAEGWLRSVEVTRNADDHTAHPHFHALLMVPASYFSRGYVKHEEWVKRWRDALRADYEPVLDVRAVKSKQDGQTLQAAVVETLKYATKAEDSLTDPEWLYVITEQLHKLRFLASGGVLKGVLKEDFSDKEMIAGDEPMEDDAGDTQTFFNWNPKVRKYVKKD